MEFLVYKTNNHPAYTKQLLGCIVILMSVHPFVRPSPLFSLICYISESAEKNFIFHETFREYSVYGVILHPLFLFEWFWTLQWPWLVSGKPWKFNQNIFDKRKAASFNVFNYVRRYELKHNNMILGKLTK